MERGSIRQLPLTCARVWHTSVLLSATKIEKRSSLMRRIVLLSFCAIASIALLSCQQASNQPVANENKPAASPEAPKKTAAYDAEAISNRLVTQVAGVKENDVVFINGGIRDVELLEDLATATRKAGAGRLLRVRSDRRSQ